MFYILIFIFGLCIGSFLNVVINRLKTQDSFFSGRSYCPKCKIKLKFLDLVPVLSFIILKGKCRYCNKKISWQYPIVEILTGLLFVLVYINYNFNLILLLYYYIIIIFLIIISIYDIKYYLILDKIIYPAIIIAFLYKLFLNYNILLNSVLSAILASGFFLFLVLVSKEKWMGMGDVKLAVFMGLVLGWPNILTALFLSFILGAIIGIILILFKKKKIKSEVPFAPFLCFSTFIAMLYGKQILDWYLRVLM